MNNEILNNDQPDIQISVANNATILFNNNESNSFLNDLNTNQLLEEPVITLRDPALKDNLNAIETACHLLTEENIIKNGLIVDNIDSLQASTLVSENNCLSLNYFFDENNLFDDNELTVIVDNVQNDECLIIRNEINDDKTSYSTQYEINSQNDNISLSNINDKSKEEKINSNCENNNCSIEISEQISNEKINNCSLKDISNKSAISLIIEDDNQFASNNTLIKAHSKVKIFSDSQLSEINLNNASKTSNELLANEIISLNLKSEVGNNLVLINTDSNLDKVNSENTDHKTSRCIPYIKENKKTCSLLEPSENYMPSGISELLFPYICHMDGCKYTSIQVSDLLLHFLVNHSPSKSEILCSICCNQFNVRNYHDLMNHICNDHYHKERQMVACSIPMCGRAFNRIHELVEHLSYFHDDINNKFPCSFCFEEQTDSIAFESHIRKHFKNILICSYCSKSFDERESLLSHIESVHPGQAKKISTFVQIINNERLLMFKELPKNVHNKNLEAEIKNLSTSKDNLEPKNFDTKSNTNFQSKTMEKSNMNHFNIKDTINDHKKSKENSQSNIHIKSALNEIPFYSSKKLYHPPSINDHIPNVDKACTNPVDTLSEYIEVPNLDRPDIQLAKADKGMKENCTICSYSCNTSIEMHDHHLQCHMNGFNGVMDIHAPFCCRLCCTHFQLVDQLLDHLAHHWGKHILRYYSCPYCAEQSDRMQVIEDHLVACHADKRFKFEVNQDTITYLQGMLKCPKCEAVLKWKSEFINHLDKDHKLKKCVEFLENEYTACEKLDSIYIPAHIIDCNEDLACPTQPFISHVKSMSTSHMINDHGIAMECNSKYSAVTDNSSPTIFGNQYFPNHTTSIHNFPGVKIPAQAPNLNCHLCPFTCSKLLNFQKHMMIHERACNLMEGYKCSYCEFAHDRINCIKFHLSKYHADRPIKFRRITNGKELEIEANDDLLRPSYKYQLNRSLGISVHAPNRFSNNDQSPSSIPKYTSNVISSFSNSNFKYNPVAPPPAIYDGIILGQTIDNEPFDSTRIKAEPIANDAKVNLEVLNIINQVKNQNNENLSQLVNQNQYYREPSEYMSCKSGENLVTRGRVSRKRNKWSASWEYSYASGFKPYSSNLGYKLPKKRKWLKSRGPSYLSGIGKDYLQSNLPAGMIYDKPVKCPECEFRNRVRVNLVRHIKAMHSNSSKDENQVDKPLSATPKIKEEIFDDSVEHANSDSCHLNNGDVDDNNHSNQGADQSDGNTSFRKIYECAYCKMTSKWNRRDISLHILHTHMRRRVYTCNYCEFGSSKSPELVVQHSQKHHPDKPISVNDCLSIFNAISSVNEGLGTVQLVYIKPNEGPLWTLQELENEFGVKSLSRPVSADSRCKSADLPPKKRIKLEDEFMEDTSFNGGDNGDNGDDDPNGWKESKKMFYEWQCTLCGLTSSKSFRIKHHLIFHHLKLKPFFCPVCRIYRWRKEQIEDHMSLEHPNEILVASSTVEEKASYIKSYLKKVRVSLDDDQGYTKLLKIRSDDAATDNHMFKKPFPTFYRCLLCNFEEQRHDKTKYHVIKQHLKIGLFSCPFCKLYQWSRPSIERHISDIHPGRAAVAKRTFDEYADYFTTNIEKISTKQQFKLCLTTKASSPVKEIQNKRRSLTQQNRRHSPPGSHTCRKCGYIAETETALVSHTRVHRLYACGYCDFSNNLASKVQSHCATQHPDLPTRHIQVETDDLPSVEDGEAEKQKMLVCRICSFIAWDEEMASSHALESHDSSTPDFDLIERSLTDLNGDDPTGNEDQYSPLYIDESLNADSEKEEEVEGIGKPGIDFLYHCCICNMYQSNKVTVMRHHVMSHLHYQPYRCPYCPSAWSVKSSPITKHVKTKHADKDAVFECVRDETLESKVRAGFKRVPIDNTLIPETAKITRGGAGSGLKAKSVQRSNVDKFAFTIPLPTKKSHLHRKTYYRCSICGLGTRIKTDMRHHLMREVQYKPYRCLYCGYTEPSKSSMGKHFRVKHPDQDASIAEERDANQDAEVEKMLDACQVGYNPADKRKRWPGKSLRSRRYGKEIKEVTTETEDVEEDEEEGGTEVKQEDINVQADYDQAPQKPRFSSADLLATISGPPYECPHCTYSSPTIKPLQAHMVHHTPHRYKCGYCPTKSHYPSWMMKHIKKKHPGKMMKMVSLQQDADAPIQKCMRRHHAKRSKKLTMSLRNCNSTGRLFESRSRRNRSPSDDDSETIPDDEDDEDDKRSTDDLTSAEQKNNYQLREVTVLVKPLRYPRIEVLPEAKDGEAMLQRCGFCPFETFSTPEFASHVRQHTEREPVRCARCAFASFEVIDVERHWETSHAEEGQTPRWVPLAQPYSMEDYELNKGFKNS